MTANAITLYRLLLTLIVLVLFGQHRYLDIVCIATIGLIFALDAIDGYIARKQNRTSAFGAVFDIAADRIIENVFWIYFAGIENNIIPIWMPIAVVVRGILTDSVRSMALKQGKTPFEMMAVPWTRALTSSRISRLLSGASKAFAFLSLPIVMTLEKFHQEMSFIGTLRTVAFIGATVAVIICLIRGVPVLIDGWRYVKSNK